MNSSKFISVGLFASLLMVVLFSCSKTEVITDQLMQEETSTFTTLIMPEEYEKTVQELQALAQINDDIASENRGSRRNLEVPGDYSRIRDAANAALPGATITVNAGSYDELVRITKDGIKVVANGQVNLHGGFQVFADDAEIDGFNITPGYQNQGILIAESSRVKVKNNVIIGDDFISLYGIWMSNSHACVIENNHLENHRGGGMTSFYSQNSVIKNNTAIENDLTGSGHGIILWGSKSDAVVENNCSDNPNMGIFLNSAERNTIMDNYAMNNGNCDIRANGASIDNIFVGNTADCLIH